MIMLAKKLFVNLWILAWIVFVFIAYYIFNIIELLTYLGWR